MKFEDLKKLYLKKKQKYGKETYNYISELLEEAKVLHKKDWEEKPTPNGDYEQSWRAFKGKNLERLVQYIITDEITKLGLKSIDGNKLERKAKLSKEQSILKRSLAVDYGEYGLHLPDVDIVIYNPETLKIVAVISIKVTLRERIAQTGYWKLKLLQDETTKHIKVLFITPDEDKTLKNKKTPVKKGRAIVETDLDGSYILTEDEIDESKKVKLFRHFIDDLKTFI